jgi:SAM-dependent methyltransferase
MTETDWSRFTVETIGYPTYVKRNLIHAELLWEVVRRARGGVLEVGIGSGAQSSILSRIVPRVVAVDNDSRIIAAARLNIERYGPGVQMIAADAFALPFVERQFGVSISQGLMEHFPDGAIADLIREQLRVSNSVVFSVPSDRYPRQDVGNERLMPPAHWAAIVRSGLPASGFRVRARYYRFDPESWKYSALARRRLGSFSVLVTVDPDG